MAAALVLSPDCHGHEKTAWRTRFPILPSLAEVAKTSLSRYAVLVFSSVPGSADCPPPPIPPKHSWPPPMPPMLGFHTFRSARLTRQGMELMHMIKKGQMVSADGQELSPQNSSMPWHHKNSGGRSVLRRKEINATDRSQRRPPSARCGFAPPIRARAECAPCRSAFNGPDGDILYLCPRFVCPLGQLTDLLFLLLYLSLQRGHYLLI